MLAGHSTGGVYALVYAARYPAEVAGMVLLDSAGPEQFTALPDYPAAYSLMRRGSALLAPLARTGLARLAFGTGVAGLPAPARDRERAIAATPRQLRGQRDEISRLPAAFEQAAALHDLGGRPLIVLTAGRGQQRGWAAAQDRLAALSGDCVHRVVAGAQHAALLEDRRFAALSAQAATDVVTAVRSGRRLSA